MSAFDFIIEQINCFLLTFTNAKVRYGYDSLAKVHTIEVHPANLFDQNTFQNWEGSIIEDFIKSNPTENICICPEDKILGVGDLLFEKEGIGYGSISLSKNPHPLFSVFTTVKTEKTILPSSITLDENVNIVPCSLKEVDNDYSLAA